MDTKEKSTHRSLDQRIASALNGEIATLSTLSDLIIAVEEALPINLKALESERIRMLDPTNPDPEKSRQMLDRITLERERLQAALPLLEARYHKAEHRERKQALLPKYNEVVEDYNQTSAALVATYTDFCEKFVPLLNATVRLNDAIRKMNAEVHAKGLTLATIPTIAEGLLDGLTLPAPGGGFLWPDPKLAHAVSVQIAEQMGRVYASPLRQAASSPDWWAARALSDREKIKQWEQRNELLEQQKEAEKQEYIAAQHRAARGK